MSTVVITEASEPWNVWEQALGRTHRDGRNVEVLTAMANLRAGHEPRHTLHSTRTLVEATQALRAGEPAWGAKFRKDPRRFSSTPRIASAAQVAAFIDGVRIQ